MTPQELKNSILQLAIQGKLVEQRPEEGTGEELYRRIQAEKHRLIKEGKLKKEKPLPEITEEEKPFDIPDSWKWVRVRDCISNRAGLAYDKNNLAEKSDDMIRVLRGGNITDMGYIIKPDDVMISSKYVKTELFLKRNTIITPAVTSLDHVGKMGRIESDYNNMVVGGFVLMLEPHYNNDIFSEWLLYAFSSKYFRDCCRNIVNKSGQAFYNLSREKMMALIIPLPPLAEQKRIVAKIEELLPFIDRYEKAWNKLEDLNKRFPIDLQKSVLQLAIQGKLVEQRPEEGTGEELYQQIQTEKQRLVKAGTIKKEKPLPKITEDEILFDIPERWKWVRFGNIINIVSARRVHQSDWKTSGIPFYRAREIAKLASDGYVDNELYVSEDLYNEFSKSGCPQPGDLMVTAVGTLGKAYIVEEGDKFYYKDASVICFENYAHISSQYLKYIMQSEMMMNQIRSNSSGTTVATLTMVRMVEYIFPLPPLAEQKRIVTKLEETLPLCERLKK